MIWSEFSSLSAKTADIIQNILSGFNRLNDSLLQVCRDANYNRLHPHSANELQKSNFRDGGTRGA